MERNLTDYWDPQLESVLTTPSDTESVYTVYYQHRYSLSLSNNRISIEKTKLKMIIERISEMLWETLASDEHVWLSGSDLCPYYTWFYGFIGVCLSLSLSLCSKLAIKQSQIPKDHLL